MSEDRKPFTVTDRRHFTTEGGVREDPETPSEAPLSADAPPSAADRGAAAPPSDGAGGTEDARPGTGEHAFPSDLPGLFLSLGTQASLLLLGGPGAPPDLEGARSLITLLETLQRKTEGHRTEEEDRILEGLLYELRMAYVARSKAAGP